MKRILSKSVIGSALVLVSIPALAFKVYVPALTLALGPATTPTSTSASASTITGVNKTIFGLDKGQDFQSPTGGRFYIQLGSFKSKANAEKIVKAVRAQTNTPVTMSNKRDMYYVVTLGPIPTAEDVRSISESLSSHLPRLPITPPVREPKPVAMAAAPVIIIPPEQDNFYMEGDIGFEGPIVNNTIPVYNGFGFFLPPPFDYDSLSTKPRWGSMVGFGVGYRWQPNTKWLPAYSLGIRYKHFFPTNIGGDVSLFSLEELTDFKYQWNVTADIVMVGTKLNIFQVKHFLPFFSAGAGLAFNRTNNYSETPLTDEDSRPNPGFRTDYTCRFTYSFGVGIDWQVQPQFIVSLAYEFQNLGSLYSGNGVDNFENSSLYSKTYQSNNIFLSMSYLFGGNNTKTTTTA